MERSSWKPFWGVALCFTLLSCGAREPAAAPPADAEKVSSHKQELEEKAARQWLRLQARQTCNLLNGCPPAEALVSMGPDVAAQAATQIVGRKRAPHWRVELLRALRFVRDHRVQSAQTKMLHDQAWLIRAYAAVGLGYARDKVFREKLKDFVEAEVNYGAKIGYFWALTTLDPREGRAKLIEHLSVLPESRDIRVHLVALDAIRSLKLVELRGQVRSWLNHRNFFVVRDAVRTVSDLHDRSGIPLLIPLLDHQQPMVRRESLSCLQRFTGLKHARKRPAFEKWCEEHCHSEWERPGQNNKTTP